MAVRATQDFDATAAAAGIVGEIASNAAEGERLCRPPDATLRALADAGMLSLWRPRTLGGHACDPVTYVKAAEAIATADPAAAWIMHGVSASWLDLRMASVELVDEVVASHPTPVLADTYNRPMRAVPVDSGYRVSGATPFASGCRVADWIGHTALDGDKLLLMFHPRGALEIQDDWDALGIRGSASNTVSAEQVFVPVHRTIELGVPLKPSRRFAEPLYRMPTAIVPAAIAAVSLGILSAALSALQGLGEHSRYAASSSLRHRPLAQVHFGRGLATYRAARSYLHQVLDDAWQRASRGDDFDLHARADLFLAYTHTLQNAAAAVREIAKAAGTAAIYKGNPIERALRDSEVTSHHAFGAEGRYASAAQAYWDVEVDFPLLRMN